MIVRITGSIEIDLDDPSGHGSVEGDFDSAIEDVAEQWGVIRSNGIKIVVTGEKGDPQPEDES